jgi:hypothetical protein
MNLLRAMTERSMLISSNTSSETLRPASERLFPHISREIVTAIATFDFRRERLGDLLRVKYEISSHKNSQINSDADKGGEHLVHRLPDVLAFVEAWTVFTAILQNERPTEPIAPALNAYLCTIIALSRASQWRNVLSYHLAFVAKRAQDRAFDVLLWSTADPALLLMYCPPKGLLSLNDDCLHSIIEILRPTVYHRTMGLKDFSMCCSRLRTVCLPFIFSRMSYPRYEDGVITSSEKYNVIPDRLLPHIR